MNTYLEQLEGRCATRGIPLDEVCKAEGVASTTLSRWRKGESTPRQGTAEALFARLAKMRPEAA